MSINVYILLKKGAQLMAYFMVSTVSAVDLRARLEFIPRLLFPYFSFSIRKYRPML